ncbi:MAG: CHAT domain-containing protein [Stigonema ocellatum SAG 48.90 = DSM 106950]|nr:CHAT domain-containing protein [Stigonema ocellatum SAG 48.90 = DSM 106950]
MARKRSVFFRALQPIFILKSKCSGRGWMIQLLLALMIVFVCIMVSPVLAKAPAVQMISDSVNKNLTPSPSPQAERGGRGEASESESLVEQGKKLYEAGRFTEAVLVLQQAVAVFKDTGDGLREAMTLSNLSLAYQQLGLWKVAENAIAHSLLLLGYPEQSKIQNPYILAQALDVQGRLQLAQGKTEAALTTWQQAANIYQQIGDDAILIRNRINSAQALQASGFYLQARDILMKVEETLGKQPNSSLKATGLRSLGNVLRVVGDLKNSQEVLGKSLEVARGLQSNQAVSEALFSLGNTARAQRDTKAALQYYQQAASASNDTSKRIQAQLNQLSLLIETKRFPDALALSSQIQSEISNLSPSRTAVYTKINFAESLMKLGSPHSLRIAQILATAVQQAQSLQDLQAESYALGTLGELYEKTLQLDRAQELTEKALSIAQSINASDIAYQWEWQLGRLLKNRGDIKGAIASYDVAYKTLQSLRKDLVAINPDIQFSFRERVEPVYRELVELLLRSPQPPLLRGDQGGINPENLKHARDVIESLQLAELNNFFRSACLSANLEIDPVVDKKDQRAAVIYPIILPNRLDVILKLPNQNLRHYRTLIDQNELGGIITSLRDKLLDVAETVQVQQQSQKIYDWLIRPAETELAKSGIKTLVFVLDGELRNIPMAALYDKQQQKYLVEKYAIALTPGLQLLDPRPLRQVQLNALTAGVSKERLGFPQLQNVPQELKGIRSEIPRSQELLDQNFTKLNLQKQLQSAPFSVVHLATHGEFSSDPDKTFILTWDQLVKVKDFDTLLRVSDQGKSGAMELLVLSACKTAAGDKRAALGLAGVAVRAGARSTLATLWSVDDQYTAALMSEFYRGLKSRVTKAEALQHAQLAVFANEKRPYFWAPYVLVGNWL